MMRFHVRARLETFALVFSAAALLALWGAWSIPLQDTVLWLVLLGVVVAVLFVSIAFYRSLGTPRGLGIVLALHLLAQVWLQWQWGLWNAPNPWVQNLNLVALGILWATLFLVLVSLTLVLVWHDVGGIALAVVWVGWPALLIGITAQFGTMSAFDQASLHAKLMPFSALCLLGCLAPLGAMAFFGRLGWVLIKEVTGREP